ncbi:MAG: glycosyltransferase family 4 protein [Rhodobacteraceae bacterium]|nr:glycosyltransferase family 4 protein [Paracoccaceae bacterium]
MAPQRIGIGWQVGVPSGWGTYGVNLAVELARRNIDPEIFFAVPKPYLTEAQATLLTPHLARQPANLARFRNGKAQIDGPLLHALGDKLDLPDILAPLRGKPEFGVVFFESATIPPTNIEKTKRFAAIIAGSSWNAEVAKSQGVGHVRFCPQGVDLDVFTRAPRTGKFAGRFAVFSGGKLEYRKGQDLVVAAFKKFHSRYPDSVLVTAWHNPWPAAALSLGASAHVVSAPGVDPSGRLDVSGWLIANGVPADAFVDLGGLSNLETPAILNEVDIAVLPSRCEGGTNLVAMECMAVGLPVALSRNTGHLDLIQDDNCYALNLQIPIGQVAGRPDLEGWGESSIDEIVQTLERAYTDSRDRAARGDHAAAFMKDWSWPNQVGRLLDVVAEFT